MLNWPKYDRHIGSTLIFKNHEKSFYFPKKDK